MSVEVSRSEFLARGVKGGAALLVAGSAVAALAPVAAAAPLSDNDLAIARVLVAAELLGIDFYQRSIASKKLDKARCDPLRADPLEREGALRLGGADPHRRRPGPGDGPRHRHELPEGHVRFRGVDHQAGPGDRDDHARLLPRRGRGLPGDRHRRGARHYRRERSAARRASSRRSKRASRSHWRSRARR